MLPMPFARSTTYEGHSGQDFPQAEGTTIPASAAGVVEFSGWYNERAGNAVIVRYDGINASFLYCHQPDGMPGAPKKGAQVALGSSLGQVGQTGSRVTGPHLHLGVESGAGALDQNGVWRYFDRTRFLVGTTIRQVADVQRIVGAKADNDWGDETTRLVTSWQTSQGLTADGVWGPISDARAFPPAGSPADTNEPNMEGDVTVTYCAGTKQKYQTILANAGLFWIVPNGSVETGPVVWLTETVLAALIQDARGSKSKGAAPVLIYDTTAKHWLYAAHGGVVILRGDEERRNIIEQLNPPRLKVPGSYANIIVNNIREGKDG